MVQNNSINTDFFFRKKKRFFFPIFFFYSLNWKKKSVFVRIKLANVLFIFYFIHYLSFILKSMGEEEKKCVQKTSNWFLVLLRKKNDYISHRSSSLKLADTVNNFAVFVCDSIFRWLRVLWTAMTIQAKRIWKKNWSSSGRNHCLWRRQADVNLRTIWSFFFISIRLKVQLSINKTIQFTRFFFSYENLYYFGIFHFQNGK